MMKYGQLKAKLSIVLWQYLHVVKGSQSKQQRHESTPRDIQTLLIMGQVGGQSNELETHWLSISDWMRVNSYWVP